MWVRNRDRKHKKLFSQKWPTPNVSRRSLSVRSSSATPLLPSIHPQGYNQEPWLQSQDFTCDFWYRQNDQWQRQCFYDADGMFRYRRLQRSVADDQVRPGDVTVLNWSTSPIGCDDKPPDPDVALGCGNDYVPGVLVGVSREERQRQIQAGLRSHPSLHPLSANPDPRPQAPRRPYLDDQRYCSWPPTSGKPAGALL